MSSNQISHLTAAQIGTMETADLRALSTASLSSMTTDQIQAITTDSFQVLSTQQIAALTTAQVHALTTEQVHALTTDQIAGLETRDMAAMDMNQVAAFDTNTVGHMTSVQLDSFFAASPIVLDLDGNGVSTTAASHGVNFDLNGTGNAQKVGWVSATDGLLVMDRNGDGKISDGTELFGVATKNADGTRAGNGYAAMALEDSNHDGKLSAADQNWNKLQVWVDANQDGKTDGGELHGLAEFGVASLDLKGLVGTEVDHGNLLGLVSSFTKTDGSQHAMADVWFAKDATPAPQLHELIAAPAADVLPAALAAAALPEAAPAAHVAPSTPHRVFGETRPAPLI